MKRRRSAGETGTGAEPAALRGRLDALAADVERHFSYEEEHLLPALDPAGAEAGAGAGAGSGEVTTM